MVRSTVISALLAVALARAVMAATALQAEPAPGSHAVEPGDTWPALAARYQVDENALRAESGTLNRQLEPVIGESITLPAGAAERGGRLVRPGGGGLVATAAAHNLAPWALAAANGMSSPYDPPLQRPLLIATAEGTPKDWPIGLTDLEVSQAVAAPGAALGFRGSLETDAAIEASLGGRPWGAGREGNGVVGLGGFGAFYGSGRPELRIKVGDGPVWAQPWRVTDREWIFQDLTLAGEAAEIDQAEIEAERERVRAIWAEFTPEAQWDGPFQLPIADFLEITAGYGARRSYNGGPVRSYHEGVDFSAYAGTPVRAPAAGTVVLAEPLIARGGAVMIDHGLGIYTGYYHLSAIHATVGQAVRPGDLLGEVGTTGLSTGNHLHWDLLASGSNVDAQLWMDQNVACWVLEGLGRPCAAAPAEG
jgi:LysM repeat protein